MESKLPSVGRAGEGWENPPAPTQRIEVVRFCDVAVRPVGGKLFDCGVAMEGAGAADAWSALVDHFVGGN